MLAAPPRSGYDRVNRAKRQAEELLMRSALNRCAAGTAGALRAVLLPVLSASAMCGTRRRRSCPYTPAVGTPSARRSWTRCADLSRAELKQNVMFVAAKLTACRGWAFLEATPQQPDGQPVDWTITPYREAAAEDMCGGDVDALLAAGRRALARARTGDLRHRRAVGGLGGAIRRARTSCFPSSTESPGGWRLAALAAWSRFDTRYLSLTTPSGNASIPSKSSVGGARDR